MRRGFFKSPEKKQAYKDANPCVAITVYLPKSLSETLDDISTSRGIPKSRLICYAVDNELDQADPFNYPSDLPDIPYVEFAYAAEAQRIVTYMKRWVKGIGRDMLVLARRDLRIATREEVLLGYREAVMKDMIEERPPAVDAKFPFWSKDYRFAFLKSVNMKKLNPLANEKSDEGPTDH